MNFRFFRGEQFFRCFYRLLLPIGLHLFAQKDDEFCLKTKVEKRKSVSSAPRRLDILPVIPTPPDVQRVEILTDTQPGGQSGDPTNVGLSYKLQKIRNYLGLRNGEILVKINPNETNGNNRSRISEYESGNREPSQVEILYYARLAGISIETLLDNELNLPDEIENCPGHPRCKKRGQC